MSCLHRYAIAAVCLAVTLILPARAEPPDSPPRTDATGDPLPAGALARMGTVRLKHGGGITALAFAPDGKALVSASSDRTLRLWDPDTGQELRRFTGHQGGAGVGALALAADGKVLFAGQSDGTALAWDLAKVPHGEAPPAVALQPADLGDLWSELGSADAVKAYHAVAALEAAPKQAVPYVREHLRPGPSAEQQRIAGLIADLDAEDFAVREKATDDLARLSRPAEGALRKALDGKPSAEMRRCVQQLLEKLPKEETRPDPGPVSEELRALRAVEVLEGVGTDEAGKVLEELAPGPADARLTREAKAALGRLGK